MTDTPTDVICTHTPHYVWYVNMHIYIKKHTHTCVCVCVELYLCYGVSVCLPNTLDMFTASLIKGAIARVVRVRTGNGPMALVNIMFPLWSCSLSLITAMLQKEDGEVLYSSYTLNNAHFRRTRNNS